MPVLSFIKHKNEIYNGKLYTIESITNKTVKLSNEKDPTVIKVSRGDFKNMFVIAFAVTVAKFQGESINYPHGIDLEFSDCINLAYTAFSRTTHEDLVYVTNLKPYYKEKVYSKKAVSCEITKYPTGHVYRITLDNKKGDILYYIGKIRKTIEERLIEHQTTQETACLPYQKEYTMTIDSIATMEHVSDEHLDKLETKYIHLEVALCGDKCINKNKRPKKEKSVIVKTPNVDTRYKITDDKKKKRFYIKYRGKWCCRYSYNEKNKDQIRLKTEEKQRQLRMLDSDANYIQNHIDEKTNKKLDEELKHVLTI